MTARSIRAFQPAAEQATWPALRWIDASHVTDLHLYLDDSGSRYSDRAHHEPRTDGMDYFALGGVMVEEDDLGYVFDAHAAFITRWGLTEPLHSTKIRGRRGAFSFLKKDAEAATRFYADLDDLVLSAPAIALACVIDRPGYVARYAEKYPQPWLLCQTAFAILIERAAKHAHRIGKRLVVYFEESGKHEDRALMDYMRTLKATGMPFKGSATAGYESLSPEDFRRLIRGEPNRIKKQVPMIQFADLVLYAMARGGYSPEYPPFKALHARGKILDALLDPANVASLGVKYSCFDTTKARVSPSL